MKVRGAGRPSREEALGACCLLLLACLFVSGCSKTRLFRGRIEKRIAARLGTLIGPADHYRVRILDTRDAELVIGHIRRLEIESANVMAGRELRLESLVVSARGIRFRGGPDDLATVRDSRVVVTITEAALNEYLAGRPLRHQPRVRFNNGTVTLFGNLRILTADVAIETSGRLEIAAGQQLLFRAEQVVAPDLQLPGDGTEFVERRVNPLVDLRRLEWPIRLDAVHLGGGKATLEGSLVLPESDDE